MGATIFTEDFKPEPWWWDATPPDRNAPATIPGEADVGIVGAGYTGLHAALALARGGRSVVVFDKGAAGEGCSTRNGGQISTSVKPDLDTLTRQHGADVARAILAEGRASLAFMGDFVTREGIDCDFSVVGRFHAAHSPAAFDDLRRSVENQPKGFEVRASIVPREDQGRETGSRAYHGGVVYHDHAAIDPAKYHRGLLDLARTAGAIVVPGCAVQRIEEGAIRQVLHTDRGPVRVRDVVLATNGYTGSLSPWHRRRIIPIGSYMIATEELPRDMIDRMFPNNRIVSDSRKVVYYYRASPDRRRILFGGRVSAAETDPRVSAPRLRDDLVRLFPELSAVRLSHSWMGFVGYTFDTLAHTGSRGHVHHAMGYCGSGVGMASYLGARLGQRLLGQPDGATAFEVPTFQSRPLYSGKPWFLAASVAWYRWRDRTAT